MFPPSSLRNIRLLALFNFFSDFRLYGPVMIIYFAAVSGSYALATSVLAITMLSSAVLEVPTGVLSDRLGRARITLCGAAAGVAAVVLYAAALDYWVLVVGAGFEGLARALYSGNNQALLYDTLVEHGRESEYHHYAGHVGSMFQLALATSAVLGGVVAGLSLRIAVIASIVPALACVAVALLMREPAAHVPAEVNPFAHIRQSLRNIRRNPQLRKMVVANAVQYGSGESAFNMQPAFINTLWPTWALGIARFANNGLAFMSFRLAGRTIDHFGATKTLLVGQMWANAANLLAVVKPTAVSPAIIASESVSFGTSSIAQDTLLQREFTDRERATTGSLGSLLGSIVFGLLFVVVGVVADHFSLRMALIVCQVVSIAGLPLLWMVHAHAKRTKRTKPTKPTEAGGEA